MHRLAEHFELAGSLLILQFGEPFADCSATYAAKLWYDSWFEMMLGVYVRNVNGTEYVRVGNSILVAWFLILEYVDLSYRIGIDHHH